MVVDGHFKLEFDTLDAAEKSSRKLKSACPMLKSKFMTPLQKPEP